MSGMELNRAELTAKADSLGIPWTNASSNEEILGLIKAREEGAVSATAKEDNPDCYGLMWDPLKADVCKGCPGQNGCLEQFVKTTLPETMQRLGKNPALSAISAQLDVSEEALAVAVEKMNGGKVVALKQPPAAPVVEAPPAPAPTPAPVEAAPAPEAPAPVAQPEVQAATEPVTEKSGKKTKEEKDAEKLAKVAEKEQAKAAAKAAKDAAAAAKKAEKEAAKQKAAAEKEAAKAAEAAEAAPANPTSAAPALPAEVAAKAPKAKPANRVGVRADRRRENPWGDHTYSSRFQKERKRSPVLAKIKPGTKLFREYEGHKVEVVAKADHYQYDGKQWPTLYSVVKEVVGTVERSKQMVEGRRPPGSRQLCNWSAVRFFKESLISQGLLEGKLRQRRGPKPKAPPQPSKQSVKHSKPKAEAKPKAKAKAKRSPPPAKPKAKVKAKAKGKK